MVAFSAKPNRLTKEIFFSCFFSNGSVTHTYADLMRYCPFTCNDGAEAMEIGTHLIGQFHGLHSVIDMTYNSRYINGQAMFSDTVGIAISIVAKEPRYTDFFTKFAGLPTSKPTWTTGGEQGEMLIAAKRDGTGYFTMLNVSQTKAATNVTAQGNYTGSQVNYIPVDSVPRTRTNTASLIVPFLVSFNRNI